MAASRVRMNLYAEYAEPQGWDAEEYVDRVLSGPLPSLSSLLNDFHSQLSAESILFNRQLITDEDTYTTYLTCDRTPETLPEPRKKSQGIRRRHVYSGKM